MNKSEKILQFDPNGIGLRNDHFMGLPFDESDARVVIQPVPWDVTASYAAGTASAPFNILQASPQLDLYDPEIADAWQMGIYMRPPNEDWLNQSKKLRLKAEQYIEFLEAGGKVSEHEDMGAILDEINAACEKLHEEVEAAVSTIVEAKKVPAILGGEHSAPLGLLRVLDEAYAEFGILQIDAHMDLREAYEGFTYSHASIFHHALELSSVKSLVQVGIRDCCEAEIYRADAEGKRVHVFMDREIQATRFEGKTWQAICESIITPLPDYVYISFDIDGLQPQLCPGTGTPVPGGLQFEEALYLIKRIVMSGRKIIGFDLCEVAGLGHEWDANVGARLLYRLANWAGVSWGGE